MRRETLKNGLLESKVSSHYIAVQKTVEIAITATMNIKYATLRYTQLVYSRTRLDECQMSMAIPHSATRWNHMQACMVVAAAKIRNATPTLT